MSEQPFPEAWIELPSEADVREQMRLGDKFPYDFGFIGAMTRLIAAHDRIGAALGRLFAQATHCEEVG